MDEGTRQHSLILAIGLGVALLVAGAFPANGLAQSTPFVGVAGAQGDADCPAASDGPVFVTDSGLEAVHDGEDVGANPFVNETTLAFPNVTLMAVDNASVRVTAATTREICLRSVEPAAADVVVSPAAGPAVTVLESLDRLSYGEVDYAASADEVDLTYEASGATALRFAVADDYQNGTVEALDGDGDELATGTVDEAGTVTLDLPAGSNQVNLRVVSNESSDETPRETTDETDDDGTDSTSTDDAATGAGEFDVELAATNAPVEAGASLEVTVVVENVGERSDTQTVTLRDFDGRERDDSTVSLDSGERNDSVALVWETTAEDAGAGTLTVDTENDSASTTVTVEDPGGAFGWGGGVAGQGLPIQPMHVWGILVVAVGLGFGGFWLYVRRD